MCVRDIACQLIKIVASTKEDFQKGTLFSYHRIFNKETQSRDPPGSMFRRSPSCLPTGGNWVTMGLKTTHLSRMFRQCCQRQASKTTDSAGLCAVVAAGNCWSGHQIDTAILALPPTFSLSQLRVLLFEHSARLLSKLVEPLRRGVCVWETPRNCLHKHGLPGHVTGEGTVTSDCQQLTMFPFPCLYQFQISVFLSVEEIRSVFFP